MLKRWWRDLIRPDDLLSQIDNSLAPNGSLVIEKTQYDAFHRTALEQVLTEQDIRQVVVTGVMTHLCCETTARSAFTRGFEVLFAVDGTATYTEAFHLATLTNLAHGFATLMTIEEIIDSLRCRVEE
jgi:isochorismate hydrolase